MAHGIEGAASLATTNNWVALFSGATATAVSLGIIASQLRRRRRRQSTAPKPPPVGASAQEIHDHFIRMDQWIADHPGDDE